MVEQNGGTKRRDETKQATKKPKQKNNQKKSKNKKQMGEGAGTASFTINSRTSANEHTTERQAMKPGAVQRAAGGAGQCAMAGTQQLNARCGFRCTALHQDRPQSTCTTAFTGPLASWRWRRRVWAVWARGDQVHYRKRRTHFPTFTIQSYQSSELKT